MQSTPLKGIRVAAMTNNGATPLCARILSDWGAEVIWVEPYDGAVERANSGGLDDLEMEMANDRITNLLELHNANKKSFCIDRRNPEAIKILHKLLSTCDVFLTNNRNEALKKMTLDWETLHAKYPKLIFAHMTGYGEKGPLKNTPGYDIVSFHARAGIAMLFKDREQDAIPYLPMGIGDNVSGAMLAGGIAAALVEQQKTGKGDFVTISLYSAGVFAAALYVYAAQFNKINKFPLTRNDNMPGATAYMCKDGQIIQAAWHSIADAHERVCRVLGCEEVLEDPRFKEFAERNKHNRELIEIWDKCFLKKTADEWCEILEKEDLAFSKLYTVDQILEEQQAIENYDIYKIKTRAEGKEIWLANMPVHIGEDYKPRHHSAPLLGEHTAEIMRDLGYDEEYIQDCFARKVARDVYPSDPSKYPRQEMPEYE